MDVEELIGAVGGSQNGRSKIIIWIIIIVIIFGFGKGRKVCNLNFKECEDKEEKCCTSKGRGRKDRCSSSHRHRHRNECCSTCDNGNNENNGINKIFGNNILFILIIIGLLIFCKEKRTD